MRTNFNIEVVEKMARIAQRMTNWRLVVTRNVIIAGILLTFLGGALLSLSYWMTSAPETVREIVKEIGISIFGIGVLALIWELAARRSFMREILDSVDLADQIHEAGLKQLTFRYGQEMPWKTLFEDSQTVDLFFSYAQTWRNSNMSDLQEFVKKKQRLRVILPDPSCRQTLDELARRFRYSADETKQRIEDAAKFYIGLTEHHPNCAAIEVYFAPVCPMMAFYIFSDHAVFTLHSHQKKRTDVPAMLVSHGKPLYTFLSQEFESLIEQSKKHDTDSNAEITTKPNQILRNGIRPAEKAQLYDDI